MNAGIKDILIVSILLDISKFQNLLEDGSQFEISLLYEMKSGPSGLVRNFIGNYLNLCEFYIRDVLGKTWTISRLFMTKERVESIKQGKVDG